MNKISKIQGATFVVALKVGNDAVHVADVDEISLLFITPNHGRIIAVEPVADENLDAFVVNLSAFADKLPAAGLFRAFVAFKVDTKYYVSTYVDVFEFSDGAQYARVEFTFTGTEKTSAFAGRFFGTNGIKVDMNGVLYDIDATNRIVTQSTDKISYAAANGIVNFRSNDVLMSDVFSAFAKNAADVAASFGEVDGKFETVNETLADHESRIAALEPEPEPDDGDGDGDGDGGDGGDGGDDTE